MSAKLLLGVALVAVAVIAPEVIPGLIGVAAGSLTAIAVTAAVEIGVGLTESLLLGPAQPKLPATNAISRLFATLDTTAPRKIWFGDTAGATDVRYQTYSGTNQSFYEQIICAASHKVDSIDEIWIDNEKAWTKAGGVQGRYVGYLTVDTREEGTSSNGIAIDSTWTATCTLTGCAYVHMKYKLVGPDSSTASPFQGGVSQRITIRGKGALVYDPRLDSTVVGGFGAMRANDQTTWAWDDNGSRNPALQELFYELGWKINGKLAVGKGLPPSRLDLASFITAANLCDEAVSLKAGGTEPRYRSDGVLSEGDDPSAVRDTLCSTMNGTLRDNGGAIALAILHDDLANAVTPLGRATNTQIVNIDAVSNCGGALSDAMTVGVTVSGFDPTDVLVLTLPAGQTYTAWDFEAGNHWLNEFDVVPDGVAANSFRVSQSGTSASSGTHTGGSATADAARLAFGAQSITGASEYTFWIMDTATGGGSGGFDNSGGVSIQIETVPSRSAFDVGDILGDEQWDQTPPLNGYFNIVRGRRVDPSDSALYQLTDYPEQSISSPDGIDRIQTADLIMVQSGTQAQRLAKLRLMRNQYQGRYTFTGGVAWWQTSIGDVVPFTHPGLAWTAKLFRNAGQSVSRNGQSKMALLEENSAIYAWTPSTDEKTGIAAGTTTVVNPTNNPLLPGVAAVTQLIAQSFMQGMTFSIDTSGNVTVSTHTRVYPDKSVSVTGATVSAPVGTVAGDVVAVYYDDPTRAGGAVSYQILRLAGGAGSLASASYSTTNPYRHSVCAGTVRAASVATGGSDQGAGGSAVGGFAFAATLSSAWKQPVRVKTAAALAANTYANGTSGVGATLTANANGALAAIDGVTLAVGERVLVDQEVTGSHNGFYAVTQLGDATHPYILTRTADADESEELVNAAAKVSEGTTFADQEWQCTTNAAITVGTTALVFAQAGGGSLAVKDEGTTATSAAISLNFVGASVSAVDGGSGNVTVTVANPGSLGIVHAYEEQPTGTAGGSSVAATWIGRILNVAGANTISGAVLVNRTVTISLASPGVVTWNAHGLPAGAAVKLATTGALPTGLVVATQYYVVSPATNTFQLAATPGGTAINTSGSQSGTHTAYTEAVSLPAGTYDVSGTSPCYDDATFGSKIKFYNLSDGADLIAGTSDWVQTGNMERRCFVAGRFTLASPKYVSLRSYHQNTQATNGLGVNAGFTVEANHFTNLTITAV